VLSNFIDNSIRILVWWDVVDLDLKWLFADAVINGLLGGAAMVLVNAYVVGKDIFQCTYTVYYMLNSQVDKFKERNAVRQASGIVLLVALHIGVFSFPHAW